MNIAFFLRNNLSRIPYRVGKYLSLIPYPYRPGISDSYRKSQKEIQFFSLSSNKEQKQRIFREVKSQVLAAYNGINFYKHIYDKFNFNPLSLNSFEDLKTIPVINKDLLLKWDLDDRSNTATRGMKANTGGSSGKPLAFYTPSLKMGREWAHLHFIWHQQMGFKHSKIKLMLTGRSDVHNFVEYDFVRHSLRIDIYSSFEKIAERIEKSFRNVPIHFLHGYPSAIYELALYCTTNSILLNHLRQHLKGCILNSEFPHIYQRKVIEDTFNVRTYAFYGHSEGCIIAYETDINKYIPLQSYGFAEAIEIDKEMNLVGTNYYNNISPLIRYNTEDIIESPQFEEGLLKVFKIKEARKSEIIIDSDGKVIPLTGLVFGRHHKLFDYCKHIQVSQQKSGEATILFVPKCKMHFDAHDLFDTSNIKVRFTFKELKFPVRTPAGKIKLLVDDINVR